MIGIAIRLALALGLHLRNEDPKIPLSKKKTMLCTWWSLHAIECQLSAITGRSCVLSHEDCTAALPQTFAEKLSSSTSPAGSTPHTQKKEKWPTPSSTSPSEKGRGLKAPRSYLDAHLNIGLIMQKVLSVLYSPRTAQYPWSHVQHSIPTLLQELDDWKQGVLPGEDRVRILPSPDTPRETLLLRFYYFSTKILILRPCLCRSERKVKDPNDASAARFDQKMAETCVEAAIGMAGLLSVEPNPRMLYENGPWWSIVHLSE